MASAQVKTFKRLFSMSRGYVLWYTFLGLLCLLASAADISVTDGLRRLIDAATSRKIDGMQGALYITIAGFICFALFRLIVDYLAGWLDQTSVMRLQTTLVNRAHRISQAFIDKNHSGDVITRVLDNSAAAQGGLNGQVINLIQNIMGLGMTIAYLIHLSPTLTLGTVLVAAAIPAASVPLSGVLNRLWKDRYTMEGELSAFVQDSVQGGEVSRAFGLLPVLLKKFDTKYKPLISKMMNIETWGNATNLLMWTLIIAGMFFVLGYGGRMVAQGTITTGAVVAFLVSFERLGFPISSIIQTWPNLQRSLSAADRVFEVLDAPLETEGWGLEPPEAYNLSASDISIRFENVTFGYEDDKTVLKDLSFTAESNKVTAIVGESGSGKSTIIRLLMGTYLPRSGRILCGEVPITRYELRDWRKCIGYVTQDVYLFTGTILENIAMGRKGASEEDIRSSAEAANCDEFVTRIPDGYGAQIGERGVKLSGGQRQRIAIARAILKHPRLLLLDEATSSLDNESERYIQDALDRFCKGRTAVVIAHRLSTIMGADKIIFLEKGRVVEEGSHEELMSAQGRYYAMFTAAYGAKEEEAV